MKVYINNRTINHNEPVIANVDNVVTKTETFYDGFVFEETAVDMREVRKIIKGIELLGSCIDKIVIKPNYVDMDTKYYRRFPETITDKLYKKLTAKWSDGMEVYIKGNRFYTEIDGYEIALPKDMITDYDNKTLRVEFYVK